MRPPHSLISSRYFQFSSVSELSRALAGFVTDEEIAEVERLDGLGLAPVTSIKVLATILGVNSGLLWSMQRKPHRYYRTFVIPKGNGVRKIQAPRVALKIIQKWISVQLGKTYQAPAHVFGFLPGKSHIDAALLHCNAEWVYSVDIENFFQTTPKELVRDSLTKIGYAPVGAELIAQYCCYGEYLAQGSPASPILSNICANTLDAELVSISTAMSCRVTRYADDIVFSGRGVPPADLEDRVSRAFAGFPWRLAKEKTCLAIAPNRRKVHGLLVHNETPRLTKGYRNKVRAFRHLLKKNEGVESGDKSKMRGHISYADYVEQLFDKKPDT